MALQEAQLKVRLRRDLVSLCHPISPPTTSWAETSKSRKCPHRPTSIQPNPAPRPVLVVSATLKSTSGRVINIAVELSRCGARVKMLKSVCLLTFKSKEKRPKSSSLPNLPIALFRKVHLSPPMSIRQWNLSFTCIVGHRSLKLLRQQPPLLSPRHPSSIQRVVPSQLGLHL